MDVEDKEEKEKNTRRQTMTEHNEFNEYSEYSAEQLIEQLDYFGYDSYYADCRNELIEEILYRLKDWEKVGEDNAPTVELQMGRMTNGVIIPIKRPQGEWNKCFDKNDYFIGYKCSKCENICKGIFNFCPNCGAVMRSKS